MRFRHLILLLVGGLLLVGCGGSSSSSKPADPRLKEVSYFPSGSPFVMSIATNPNATSIKQAQQLEGRYPLAAFGQVALMSKLQQLGIDYQTDIRPLFGNPISVGATTQTLSGTASRQFLVVWVTKDATKLQSLAKKLGALHPAGSRDGATLYSTGGSATLALDGATLLFAPTSAAVVAALDRHAHGGGITEEEYARETSGLPQNSVIEVFGNLTNVLAQPGAATARQVPWVAALRGYGASISATSTGITFRYHLDTTGRSLSTSQLPFAPGSATVGLLNGAPISVGVHDPAHIVSFIETVAQTANPASYATFQKREAAVRAKTGVDLTSFAKLLSGDLIVSSDTIRTIGRVGVTDAAVASRDLRKLMSSSSGLVAKGKSVRRLPGGFYAVAEGKRRIDIGIVGNQLVAGTAGPAALRGFASLPAISASGTQGAVAFRVALSDVIRMTLKHAPPKIVQTILGSLGDLTGWSSASPDGIDGSATLAIK